MICEQREIQSLDFFVSFFVKKKRKAKLIIAQIEIFFQVMISVVFFGGKKAYTQKN